MLWLFALLGIVVIVGIGLVLVGRETARLATSARPAVFDLTEATEFIADRLHAETQARISFDDVRWILLADADLLEEATADPEERRYPWSRSPRLVEGRPIPVRDDAGEVVGPGTEGPQDPSARWSTRTWPSPGSLAGRGRRPRPRRRGHRRRPRRPDGVPGGDRRGRPAGGRAGIGRADLRRYRWPPWSVPPGSSTTATSATSARRSSTTSTPCRPRSWRSCSRLGTYLSFGPDTLVEARNRGYKPHASCAPVVESE